MAKTTQNQETLELGGGIRLERSTGLSNRRTLLYISFNGALVPLTREDLVTAIKFLDEQEIA